MVTKTGTTGNDTLLGTDGIDSLLGLGGNDLLIGGKAADTLDGGTGTDTVSYDNAGSAVNVSLLFNSGSLGDAAGDVLLGFESVVGSKFADFLIGNNIDNILRGGLGADTLDGSGGIDTADYSTANNAVTVSLLELSGFAGEAAGDRYTSIENVTGSAFNDDLEGDAGSNLLNGGRGNDLLSASSGNDSINGGDGNDRVIGASGADVLNGGSGVDLLDYSSSIGGLDVNLGTSLAIGGDASGDTISGFESVIGSALADNLTGSNVANLLTGGGGGDLILGGGGNDTLAGGGGADTLNGGNGVDTLDYSASPGAVFADLKHNEAGEVTVLDGNVTGPSDATDDVILGFENAKGSAFSDALTGGDGTNLLSGGGSVDFLEGGLGRDDLIGGAGGDNFDFISFAESGNTAATRDRIRDFHHAEGDHVRFETGEDLAFIGTKAFTADDQMRFFFEGDHTVVEMNTVGKAGAEMQIEFDGHVTFVANDFAFEL